MKAQKENKMFHAIYMQILIHGTLVDQRDWGGGQGLLRLYALRNVAKLLRVLLN